MSSVQVTDPKNIKGSDFRPDAADFGDGIARDDHKLAFMLKHSRGGSVLDIGCVQHNPENYRSRYWLHKAIKEVAEELVGLDLYADGIDYLRQRGYNVQLGDAQSFDLGRRFDVITAGDILEHLENFHGFFTSAKRHMDVRSKILISTPNPWYWKNLAKAAVSPEVSNNPEHTCWLCPRTLRQLVARYDMKVTEFHFGSRYLRDRLMPLPAGWRHTSFHAVVQLA